MVIVAVSLFPRPAMASSSVMRSSLKRRYSLDSRLFLLLQAAVVAIHCTRGVAICEGCGCSFLHTEISKLLD